MNRKLWKIMFLTATLLLLLSCNRENSVQEKKEKALARVKNNFLYDSDLKNIVPNEASKSDSIQFIKKFINKWIEDEVVLAHAEENLSNEDLDIEKQLAEYKKNLIIYSYQTELVNQKLDTSVTEKEIEKYYNENKSQFTLKDNIVKVWYVKTKKNKPNAEKVKKWYKSDAQKDYISLKTFCAQHAENYFIDGENWILFDELLKEIPITTVNPELYLKSNQHIEVSDSLNAYYANIKGYRIKNSLSPLNFEKDNIKNIILNKRKLKLVEDMKKDILDKAKKSKEFEIY
ncbi:MAG: hypothetical protein ACK452_07690 [Bacteroidota bacterium]|jgi:hypothetical protein